MLAGRCLPAGVTLYGPWFPKPAIADHAMMALSIMVSGGASVTVSVETKTRLEADSEATSVLTIGPQSSKDVYRGLAENLLELVRYKYVTSGSGFAHVETANPGWLGSH